MKNIFSYILAILDFAYQFLIERIIPFFKNTVVPFVVRIWKKLDFKDLLIIILLICFVITFFKYMHYYDKSLDANITYIDSLVQYKNKVGQEYVAKSIYVRDLDQLKSENSELYNEIKNLKDNPLVVTDMKIKYVQDTIIMNADTIAKTGEYYDLKWSYNDENSYFSIDGDTRVKDDLTQFVTKINKMIVNSGITLDIIEKNGELHIIANADNPYLVISELNGAVIDPGNSEVLKKYFKTKRWGIGPYVGIGVGSDMSFSPQIGVGVTYSLIRW